MSRANNYKCMEQFGKKLRILRQRNGLTLQQLGDMLGVHNTHVSKMEQNKRTPNVAMVIKIATLFKVSFDQLMNDEFELE